MSLTFIPHIFIIRHSPHECEDLFCSQDLFWKIIPLSFLILHFFIPHISAFFSAPVPLKKVKYEINRQPACFLSPDWWRSPHSCIIQIHSRAEGTHWPHKILTAQTPTSYISRVGCYFPKRIKLCLRCSSKGRILLNFLFSDCDQEEIESKKKACYFSASGGYIWRGSLCSTGS